MGYQRRVHGDNIFFYMKFFNLAALALLATVSAKNLEDPVEDKLAVITQEDELEDLDDLEFDYDNDYYKNVDAVDTFEPERRQLDHDDSVLTYSYYSYYDYYYSNVTYSYYSYWSYSDT